MKIYEIGTGYTPIPAKMGAATEIVVEELTKSMLKKNKDVTIIDIKAKDRIENQLPIIEVNVPSKFTGTDVQLGVMNKLKRVVYSINLAFELKKVLRNEKEKVVLHFHNQYNMYFFFKLTNSALREKCVLAYTNHSYVWHGDWGDIKETINKRYFQEIYAMKNADLVYVLNEHTVDTLINYVGISKEKIVLIDNGVNTDIYSPLNKEHVDSYKDEIGLSNKKVYLQIGSVCDRKDQLGAIRLLLPILRNDKDSCFVYAGGIISNDYQKQIEDFTKQENVENQVKYLGELKPGKELNKYYNLADVMVFPSKSEGFSLVIIEAMSAGVPVIINENLQFKLADQCLKYSNDDDFVNVIQNNILDETKQHELSIMARESVVKNYSWDKVATDYLKTWGE